MSTTPIRARRHHAATALLLALILALVAGLAGCGDTTAAREDCARAGDEDGNDLADCADPACSAEPACAPCPNGTQDVGEGCDDGNMVDTDACTNVCQPARCGDGIIRAGVETCDDRNMVDTDACTNGCQRARCGDGILQAGVETCDDGNLVDTDACTSSCQPARCGDGITGPGEECDDGNTTDTDACTSTCHAMRCGDGFAQPGEACDDGNLDNTDGCTNGCALPSCGDGFLQAGEQCDDGNMIDTDACLNTCMTAVCGDGVARAGVEECDDGNASNNDACLDTCRAARCGDSVVQTGVEQCDDGNTRNTDACTSTCRNAVCGDGFRYSGVEECDDGNMANTDACLDTCRTARCGDGVVWSGVEQCDDANASNTDACTNVCRSAACGDGFVQGAEECDDGNQVNDDGCGNACGRPPTTTASPAGGVFRTPPTVTLTADEPATIYYTTDGSLPTTASASGPSPVTVAGLVAGMPLRFFAVDVPGNAEAPRTATYTLDRLGPPAVSNFTASPAGANVNLTWTNPIAPGFLDVVVARVADVAATVPTDGAAVGVGDTVGAGTVIYVGSAEAFTVNAPGPGNHTYVAWAHYGSGVYAEGRADAARLEPPPQTCEITVDVIGGNATVSAQPSEWNLGIANYFNAGGWITMDVTATSGLAGITFNPKLVVTSTFGAGGSPSLQNATGQVDIGGGGMDYVSFGPAGLADGGARTRTLLIDTGGASSITLGCQLVADQGVIYGDWCATEAGIYDPRAQTRNSGMPLPSRWSDTPNRTCTQWSSMLISPDGRYVYAAPRSGQRIAKIDTTTFGLVAGIDVNVQRTSAATARLQLDPSGRRLYASLMDGAHSGGYMSDNRNTLPHNSAQLVAEPYILEIAASTMNETSRFSLGSGDGFRRLQRIALTNDGRRLAVMLGASYMNSPNNELHLIDVSSWTELDANPGIGGVQQVSLGILRGPNIAFDRSGRYLLIGQSNGASEFDRTTFGLLDLNTFVMSTYNVLQDRVIGGLQLGPGILLLTEGSSQLQVLDPAAGVVTPMLATFQSIDRMESGAISADGTRLFIHTWNRLEVFDPTSGELVDVRQNAYGGRHVMALTP